MLAGDITLRTMAFNAQFKIQKMGGGNQCAADKHRNGLVPVGSRFVFIRRPAELNVNYQRRTRAEQTKQTPSPMNATARPHARRSQQNHRDTRDVLKFMTAEKGHSNQGQQTNQQRHAHAMNRTQRRQNGPDSVGTVQPGFVAGRRRI